MALVEEFFVVSGILSWTLAIILFVLCLMARGAKEDGRCWNCGRRFIGRETSDDPRD